MSDPVQGDFPTFTEFCQRPDPTYPKGLRDKFQCPCCNYFTLSEVGGYDICPVCFWEDDGTTNEHGFSPNGVSLAEGRANYKEIGACEARILQHVRPPNPDELS